MAKFLNPNDGVEACLAKVNARWKPNCPVPVSVEEVGDLLEAVHFLAAGVRVLMEEYRALLAKHASVSDVP